MKISPTTLSGGLLALLQSTQVDWFKLFETGDRHEVVKACMVGTIMALGYMAADRPKSAPGDPDEKRETKGVVPGTDPTK